MERYFEWDSTKAQTNFAKHGVRFEDAVLVFDDPFAFSSQDRVVDGEYRWKTIGMAAGCVLLIVAHTTRDEESGDEIIRITSARRAEPKERRRYERGKI